MVSYETQSDVSTWDAQWRLRHQSDELTALESTLQSFLAARPQEYSALWRLSRLLHFRAMQSEEENRVEETLRFFESARDRAEEAVRENSHDVEGRFWLGVNLLEWSRRKGWIQAASTLRRAEGHILRAMNQDETYHFAGPVRVEGRITHVKPLMLGGSLDRSLDVYRRALQIAPQNSTTLLYYAEALLADQQNRMARQTFYTIIKAPEDSNWVWEQARDRRLAKAHLEKMDAAL